MKNILPFIIILTSINANAIGLFDGYKKQTSNSKFLPPEEAFDFSYKVENGKINLQWIIPENYYMYKDRLKITTDKNPIDYVHKKESISKYDENFESDMNVYYESMEVEINNKDLNSINVEYQGCAEAGLCYTPQKRKIIIENQI